MHQQLTAAKRLAVLQQPGISRGQVFRECWGQGWHPTERSTEKSRAERELQLVYGIIRQHRFAKTSPSQEHKF